MNQDLYLAALNGDTEQVRDLLAGGSDPNQANAQGNTPLHAAAIGLNQTLIHDLIEAGADVNALNEAGRSALGYVLHYSADDPAADRACQQALLQAKARPGLGLGPLQWLLLNNNDPGGMIRDLLHALPADFCDQDGQTPAHLACAWLALLAYKMPAGADPDQSYAVPLRYLADQYQAGRDCLAVRDKVGRTPLHTLIETFSHRGHGWRALQNGFDNLPWLIGRLARMGADVGTRDRAGATPLHALARCAQRGLEEDSYIYRKPSPPTWVAPLARAAKAFLTRGPSGAGPHLARLVDHNGDTALNVLMRDLCAYASARQIGEEATFHDLLATFAGPLADQVAVPVTQRKRWRVALLETAEGVRTGLSMDTGTRNWWQSARHQLPCRPLGLFDEAWESLTQALSEGRAPALPQGAGPNPIGLLYRQPKNADPRSRTPVGTLLHRYLAGEFWLDAQSVPAAVEGLPGRRPDRDGKLLQAVLDMGVDPNSPSLEWTDQGTWLIPTLVLAAKHDAPPFVFRQLLAAGADVRAKDRSDQEALHWVLGPNLSSDNAREVTERQAIIQALCEAGAGVNAPAIRRTRPPLLQPAARTAQPIMAALVKAGAAAQTLDADGRNLLHYSDSLGNLPDGLAQDQVAGLGPDRTSALGETPLIDCIEDKQSALQDIAIDRLLGAGADVNGQGADRMTPIMTCVRKANVPLARKLLAAGADPNKGKNEIVKPIVHHASWEYCADRGVLGGEMMGLLLEYGFDVNHPPADRDGDTLLHYCAKSEIWSSIERLRGVVKAGADVDKPNANGTTPIETLIKSGHASKGALILMLDHSRDVLSRGPALAEALALGAGHYSPRKESQLADVLLDYGVELDARPLTEAGPGTGLEARP